MAILRLEKNWRSGVFFVRRSSLTPSRYVSTKSARAFKSASPRARVPENEKKTDRPVDQKPSYEIGRAHV